MDLNFKSWKFLEHSANFWNDFSQFKRFSLISGQKGSSLQICALAHALQNNRWTFVQSLEVLRSQDHTPKSQDWRWTHFWKNSIGWIILENCFQFGRNKSFHLHQSTMLQKFSKCQVKAKRSGNLIILLPLKFYVKSNFGGLKRSKMWLFAVFEGLNFNFGN